MCNFFTALSVFSSSIITDSLISDVEIANILIFSSDNALANKTPLELFDNRLLGYLSVSLVHLGYTVLSRPPQIDEE